MSSKKVVKNKVAVVKSKTALKKSEPVPLVRQALQITWVLNGILKRDRMSYLRIGKMLAEIRDKNLFGALKHSTMEDYAQSRLRLRKSSLYKYLNVYDWASKSHPEWLQPKPKGFIPELSDADDLRLIETQLENKRLTDTTKAELEVLHKKGLAGTLNQAEVKAYRRNSRRADGLTAFLSTLKAIRRRGAALAGMPPDAITDLDASIDKIQAAEKSKRTK